MPPVINSMIALTFVVVGLLHLMPALGLLSRKRLNRLYGITLDDVNTLILMRHRAVLFALLGVFLLGAAFVPVWRPLGFIAGFLSMLSFLTLAYQQGEYNARIRKVVIADSVGTAALLLALAMYLLA